jgi:hypothetical protein
VKFGRFDIMICVTAKTHLKVKIRSVFLHYTIKRSTKSMKKRNKVRMGKTQRKKAEKREIKINRKNRV